MAVQFERLRQHLSQTLGQFTCGERLPNISLKHDKLIAADSGKLLAGNVPGMSGLKIPGLF